PDDYRTAGKGIYNKREVIYRRRSEFLAALGLDYERVQPNLTSPLQRHTNRVAVVGEEAYGTHLNWDKPLDNYDAVVTNLPGLPLMTLHADCTPVLLYDPLKKVIGAVHSGWRGTVGKISLEAVRVMQQHYGSAPEDIVAGIGPSIGPCCYQVGEPVLSAVAAAFGPEVAKPLLPLQADSSYHFDLWQTIFLTLREAGLKPQNIEQSTTCTRCNLTHFFSYRATPVEERDNYGQFVSLICLR
ncbi:MAG: peptidoglycan editing factor PgeF, partial [Chloroflexota bacterium]